MRFSLTATGHGHQAVPFHLLPQPLVLSCHERPGKKVFAIDSGISGPIFNLYYLDRKWWRWHRAGAPTAFFYS